jgi:hypothetical protein
MARPRKVIDPEMVEKLAAMGLSAELIAGILDVDHRTIERRFAPILKKGRQKRDGRLMVRLFQEATATPCNTAALIFCAKNFLGMTDQPQVVVNLQQNAVTALGIPEDRLQQYRRLTMEFAENEAREAAAKQGQLPAATQGEVAG